MVMLYEFDTTGIFAGEREADTCQITGEPIMRVNATTIEPPKVKGDSVAVWTGEKWGVFTPVPPEPPTDEERRAAMVVTKVKAMQNLKKVGKLNLVLELMDELPRDNDVRILWDYSETLHRTDPTLVKVCTEQLGLDDEGIDNLFL
jgi:hypothetical protein